MKTSIAMFGAALVLISCKPKKAEIQAAAVETPEVTVVETVVEGPSKADTELRLMQRKNAIAELIAAHQRISRDKVDADLFKGFIRAETSPGEIAVLQNDLSEIQAQMRETKAKIPELEAKAEELSETGDPQYRVEVARFNADLAELILKELRARQSGASNAVSLKKQIDAMHRLSSEEVIAGKYPVP